MTDAPTVTRKEWLARRALRSPEAEQAKFGADEPTAGDLTIDQINPFNPHLFREDRWQEHFARLRAEDPVHFNELGSAGRYWSVTTWDDVRAVDGDWKTYSSAHGITLSSPVSAELENRDQIDLLSRNAFITMDPPQQTEQRKTVRGISAPSSLTNIEDLVRERTVTVLESLPEGETFDWVPTVSIELTTQMLATLFGFPMEDRYKLTRWSDVVTTLPGPAGVVSSHEERRAELKECIDYFERLWAERREEPGFDLVSMLANDDTTKDLTVPEQLGNLILLIVGGNDTTRNSMSGSVYALNQFPDQYDRLQADPSLVEKFVPELIRWQTPLSYMRRTATCDTELGGKQIKAGDQILMWYVSANRDEAVFGTNADEIDLDRPNAERHLSFGYGVHFCMGSRIAELQLRILWEEVLQRFERVEVVGEPQRSLSTFIKGYTHLPVQVTRN